jgi:two-component system, cell cycle sensor histidine kinase and response regulator CckA
MTPSMFGPRFQDGARSDPQPQIGTGAPLDGQTIVVVDDDAGVRAVARRALESYGYDVVEAADGVDAIGAVKERSGRVALVVTDVVMMRMGGGELSTCLALLYPGTRLLFMSGYQEGVLRRQGLLPDGGELVAKPFDPDELARRIQKVLGVM